VDLLDAEAPPQPAVQRGEDDAAALSDIALHRETRTAVAAAEKAVFVTLSSLLRKIIERRLWERYGFRDFAAHALTSGNGLNVNTNGRLYLLKCSLDIQGAHRELWLQILVQVEAIVRRQARKQGVPLKALRGNSLRTLATRNNYSDAPVSYLPSGQSGAGAADGNLLRLKRSHSQLCERVIRGELTLPAARRAAGFVKKRSVLEQIKKLLPKLTAEERAELKEMLA